MVRLVIVAVATSFVDLLIVLDHVDHLVRIVMRSCNSGLLIVHEVNRVIMGKSRVCTSAGQPHVG